MGSLWQDLRFAARVLWKKPGFAAVAVFAVALGVGANTTIFSCVNALLLRPFSYATTERLVVVWEQSTSGLFQRGSVSPGTYADWRDQTQAFEQLAAYRQRHFNLNEGEQPERIRGAAVTPNFFAALAVAAEQGRVFGAEEAEPGREQVAVVGRGLWRRRFGADASIVGKSVRLDGKEYKIVGVMPDALDFPTGGSELWVPLAFDAKGWGERRDHYLQVLGLLRPGASFEQADAEARAVSERNASLYPDTNAGRTAFVETLTGSYTRGPKPYLLVLLGAVGFVLLIACANVANLLLVHGAARQRELAVRAALGASRARLVRQLLTESLLLALTGGALGLLLSAWGVEFISRGMPQTFTRYIPGWENLYIDSRVLAFTLVASVLTGVVFGIFPALQATRTSPNESLKEGGRGGSGGPRRNRMRSLLVVTEVALSLVLLVGAGLMVRSFVEMLRADLGIRPEGVLTLELSLPRETYKEDARQIAFYEQLVERVRALPGVRAAGVVNSIPMSRSGTGSSTFQIVGREPFPKDREPYAEHRTVTPGYFEAAGTPILRGRAFTPADDERASRVVIINQDFVRRFFEGGDPLGRRIVVFEEEGPLEIVGVAADTKDEDFEPEPSPGFFRPFRQDAWGTMGLLVRADGDPVSLAPAVREAVRALDSDLPVYNVRTYQDLVDETLSAKRLAMYMMAFFACGALALAAVGLYSVMSYTVSQRTHEIGVRVALGAQTSDVLRLVMTQGALLALAGLGLGLVGALPLARLMAGVLHGVSANEPLVFGGVALALALAALLACYVPARRATRVDPMEALRHE